MIRVLRFLVLRLPVHVWRSEWRIHMLGSWALSAMMLYNNSRWVSGWLFGQSLLYVATFLGEQWPQYFKRWQEPS